MLPLYFRKYGSGRPLIILHGLFGSSDNWHSNAQVLGNQFNIFTVDARNHGLSPHCDKMTYQLMAQDVADFMQSQKLESAFLMGHSMGGKTAMVVTDQFPQLVEKLIVVDIAPKIYEPQHLELLDAMEKLDVQNCSNRKELDQSLKSAIPNPAVRQFLLKNVKRNAADEFFWQLNLAAIRENYENLNVTTIPAKPVEVPTLFIRGGKSDYILPEDEEVIRSNFLNAKIKTIPGASHWVHTDAPEEFVRVVTKFLSNQTNE